MHVRANWHCEKSITGIQIAALRSLCRAILLQPMAKPIVCCRYKALNTASKWARQAQPRLQTCSLCLHREYILTCPCLDTAINTFRVITHSALAGVPVAARAFVCVVERVARVTGREPRPCATSNIYPPQCRTLELHHDPNSIRSTVRSARSPSSAWTNTA